MIWSQASGSDPLPTACPQSSPVGRFTTLGDRFYERQPNLLLDPADFAG